MCLKCQLSLQVTDVAIDSLLGVESDNKGGNVHNLLANSDMPLSDENTGVVNRLGKTGQLIFAHTWRRPPPTLTQA